MCGVVGVGDYGGGFGGGARVRGFVGVFEAFRFGNFFVERYYDEYVFVFVWGGDDEWIKMID